MKFFSSLILIIFIINNFAFPQKNKYHERIKVPSIVKISLNKKYPEAKKVSWKKEDSTYAASWAGKAGEENLVHFERDGTFIEIVSSIHVYELPEPVIIYLNRHYKGSKIFKALKITDAAGRTFYKVAINEKDFFFDMNGKVVPQKNKNISLPGH